MWFLIEGGYVAEKKDDGKVRVRIIKDQRGVNYFEYDETFKVISRGVVPSVKDGMEKFDGV